MEKVLDFLSDIMPGLVALLIVLSTFLILLNPPYAFAYLVIGVILYCVAVLLLNKIEDYYDDADGM